MQESANIAHSYVTANAEALGVPPGYLDDAFIHLHVPAGATPKDGPSAGVAMATALLSLARDEAPRTDLAMTGELTLTGAVYPVGGIQEKLIAAKRQQLREVILPEANERDYAEVPSHVREGLTVHFVARFEEVVTLVFPTT
jgi:ATP-dependent Lon protease